MGINILTTFLIIGRILFVRRSGGVRLQTLDPKDAKMYTSIIAMLMESGALFSTFGFVCIIGHVRGSNIQNVVYYSLVQAAVSIYHAMRTSVN